MMDTKYQIRKGHKKKKQKGTFHKSDPEGPNELKKGKTKPKQRLPKTSGGMTGREFRPYKMTEKWKKRYQKDDNVTESRINPDVTQWAKQRRQQRDQKRKEEKDKKRKEQQDLLEKKTRALQKYKTSKKQKHKKIAKRNYKGQPNMASQMDLLLKQIERERTGS